MSLRLIGVITVALVPINLMAQQGAVVQKDKDAAAVELEAVIVDAGKLDDKLARINIESRAAVLVSFLDPARSEIMFREIWKFASKQMDPDFNKEKALNLILKHLFPRNAKLAKQLLAEESSATPRSLDERSTGRDPDLQREAKLASQLVASDPSAASELLERSLSDSVTPAGLGALNRLRERDPLLSDFVVVKALDGLRSQPTVVSLTGLHLLSAYVFPDVSSGVVEPVPESLQLQYFSTTYEVLRASLAESEAALSKDAQYSPATLRLRAIYQAQIATIIAALAPRYQPGLAAELNQLAAKLSPQLPANVVEMSKYTAAKLSGQPSGSPEMMILTAISTGDFDSAQKLIDDLKSEASRNRFGELLLKTQAKALLGKGDVLGALTLIRKVEDENSRLAFYLQALKASAKKRDERLSLIVIDEARILIPQVGRNGLQIRALFSFTTELASLGKADDAIEFLTSAVDAVNSLTQPADLSATKQTAAEVAMAELNDPRGLLDAEEMEQAFVGASKVDFQRAVAQAKRIQPKSVQFVARLEALREMTRWQRTTKPPAKQTVRSVPVPELR
jgi:hypothetical protein